MTAFKKENFNYHGGYLTYDREDGERPVFVARFKYTGRDKAGFQSFLIKNFTQEEYFNAYDAGSSPLAILEEKGYVSLTVRRQLKERGYPETVEGFMKMVKDDVDALHKERDAAHA